MPAARKSLPLALPLTLGLLGWTTTGWTQEAAETEAAAEAAETEQDVEVSAEAADTEDGAAKTDEGKANAVKVDEGKAVDAEKDAEKDGGKRAQTENPLGNFFKKLLVPDKPDQPIIPQHEKPERPEYDERDRPRDDVDMRAPQSPAQTQRLRRASDLVEAEQWEEALRTIEFVLDPRLEDSLVRAEDGRWVSIREEAHRLLQRFPDAYLDDYRLTHGPEAERLLEEAMRNSDLDGIVAVAARHFHTEAGHRAANVLASLHDERGEAGLAARWYRRLLEADAAVAKDPEWRLRAAAALQRAGDTERAEALVAAVRESSATAEVDVAGDERVPLDDWLSRVGRANGDRTPVLREWPTAMGTARRTGVPAGSGPLLIDHWPGLDDRAEAPVATGIPRIREQIETILMDLQDSGLPAIPAATPIAVDGVVAFRTLNGVRVVDAETGRTSWHTRAGISPEMLLGGAPLPGAPAAHNHVGPYQGGNADQHPLTHLLFRDDLWGTISSDGERLFVVEGDLMRTQQHQYRVRNGRATVLGGGHTMDYETNRVAAYSLATGRPLWQVGGPDHGEPFDPPLAGFHFLGVPVAAENELFVIGERNDEIRLIALDPATGGENWSQLVALSDVAIEKDFYRRMFGAQVSVGDGVAICPTTVGWLVAVDCRSHDVLWARRYSKPNRNNASPNRNRFNGGEVNQTPHAALGQRWLSTPPVIADGRVIVAPPEHPALFCYDLFDGKLLWERPKNNDLYVAGVVDDRVLLVGRHEVTALQLENGTPHWKTPLPTDDSDSDTATPREAPQHERPARPAVARAGVVIGGIAHEHSTAYRGPSGAGAKPAGRAVVLDGKLYVPLVSGELWGLDLADGRVASKSYPPPEAGPLGNLVAYRGTVLSLSALGLKSYEQRDVVEAEIAKAKAADPGHPEALLKEAEIHFLHRRFQEALDVLEKIDRSRASDPVAERVRAAERRGLTELALAAPGDSAEELARLDALADDAEDRRRLERLRAARFEATDRFAAAFEVYRDLALAAREADTIDGTITRDDEPHVRVRFDNWIAGRLADTWNRLSPEDRRPQGAWIAERAAAIDLERGDDAREDAERFVALFGFHPSATRLEERLIESASATAPIAVTEVRLRRLARHEDEQIAARALYRLGRLFLDAGVPQDATVYFDELVRRFPQVVVAGEEPAAKVVAALREGGALVPPDRAAELGWDAVDVKLVQTRDYSSGDSSTPVRLSDTAMPFFRDHRFEAQMMQNHIGGQQVRRLEVVRSNDGGVHWLPPLRTRFDGGGNAAVAETAGHLVCLMFQDAVSVLSPVDRRVVWSRVTRGRQRLGSFYRSADRRSPQQMQHGPAIVGNAGIAARAAQSGLLATANGDYVCTYERRRIVVRDAEDGSLRWELGRLPRDVWVAGNEQLLILASNATNEVRAFRPLDGRPLEVDGLDERVQKALRIDEDGFVVVENENAPGLLGLSGTKTVVRRVDPLTGREAWSVEFERNTGFAPAGRFLVAVGDEGTVELLDLADGTRTEVGTAPEEAMQNRTQVYAFVDRSQVYLAVNQRWSGRRRVHYSNSIPSLRVNGWMLAFGRDGSGLKWKQKVLNQDLLLPHFEHSPWVVYASRSYENRNGNVFRSTSAVVLDKRTGERLFDDEFGNDNGFRGMSIDAASRYVELNTYNGRVRFQAVPRASAESDSDDGETAEAEPGQTSDDATADESS